MNHNKQYAAAIFAPESSIRLHESVCKFFEQSPNFLIIPACEFHITVGVDANGIDKSLEQKLVTPKSPATTTGEIALLYGKANTEIMLTLAIDAPEISILSRYFPGLGFEHKLHMTFGLAIDEDLVGERTTMAAWVANNDWGSVTATLETIKSRLLRGYVFPAEALKCELAIATIYCEPFDPADYRTLQRGAGIGCRSAVW